MMPPILSESLILTDLWAMTSLSVSHRNIFSARYKTILDPNL